MSLYARPKFRPDGHPLAHAADMFERYPFATLIVCENANAEAPMRAVHTPVLVDYAVEDEGADAGEPQHTLTLHAHVARANPWWQHAEQHPVALAIAHGPHAAISASWYARPSAGTWNYSATHAHCTVTTVHDPDELRPFLERLTRTFETDPNYAVEEDVMTKLTPAIVGLRLRVQSASSTVKMSQNKDDETHANIIAGLEQRADADDRTIAAMMRTGRTV